MRRSEQTIEVPERVYRGPHYSDVFKKAWCKMAGLDTDGNIEHCNASVLNMASFSGLSKPAFERALKEGRVSGPDGGAPEFTTRRMTHRGGRGRTAIRRVRGVAYGERFVTVPGWIADAAEPRELAAVLLIAHARADGHQLTAEELAQELFHHHGKRKGLPLSERTVRRLIDRMEAKGFLDVDRRGGYQGRHVLAVRETPIEAVPEPTPAPASSAPCPDTHDGSGPDTGDGSLAIKEDSEVVTDGVAQVGGSFRRRRTTGSYRPDPVDTASNSRGGNYPVAPDTFRPTRPPLGTDDEAAFPPHVWDILQPVHDILPGLRPFLAWRITTEIDRQLGAGVWAEDIRDQLHHLRGRTMRDDIPDPGRWILGAALPPRPGPCGRPDCIRGYMRHDGRPCKACTDTTPGQHHARARGHPPPTTAAVPLQACPGCAAPYRPPLRHPNCRLCHHPLPDTA